METFEEEFKTVNALLNSNFETRAIDAFVISLIKVERQIRRIFTFLIYQNEKYKIGDQIQLRDVLSRNKNLYFEHFIIGIDRCYFKTVSQVYGKEYNSDLRALKGLRRERNKIFHGQLTDSNLSRNDLIDRVVLMKKWASNVARTFSLEIGYDGFARNSYRKSKRKLNIINTEKFGTIERYSAFLKVISNEQR